MTTAIMKPNKIGLKMDCIICYQYNTITNNKMSQNGEIDLDYVFDELDTSWLQEFQKIDKNGVGYYTTENLLFIKVHYIYVNEKQEITNLYEEKYLFKKPNVLPKEDLIGLIKRNTVINSKKYSLFSILKYNINVEPHNLKTFFKVKPQNQTNNNGDPYLQSIKNIDDVFFDKSIAMFHDLNDLIIIFLDKGSTDKGSADNQVSNKHNTTKRVYINHNIHNIHNSSNINGNNNNNKKTRRNLFKDIL
jgi:hypothetical protein